MLRHDIIKKSKADRKAYELFVILGAIYDSVSKEDLDKSNRTEDNEVQFMKVLRGTLICLNDIKFNFFSEVHSLIDFIDRTAVFGREEFTGQQLINHITAILDKMYYQFDWYKQVQGVEMTTEEICELLDYDCDIEDFIEALAEIEVA